MNISSLFPEDEIRDIQLKPLVAADHTTRLFAREPMQQSEESQPRTCSVPGMSSTAIDSTKYLGQPRRRRFPNWPSLWIWELSAAGFSITCLGLMFVLVSVMNGKPLGNWKLPIAPNSLLAIFSTLSKSSLLLVLAECVGQLKWVYFQQRPHPVRDLSVFDNASRGPLGAVQFLYLIGWRAAVASLGCLLIMLTLAMDPFTQQVLSFPLQLTTAKSDSATLQVMRAFTPDNVNIDPVGLLYQSIYESQHDYACSSEMCSWSNFSTLEICSNCTDVSDVITRDCQWHAAGGSDWISCDYAFPFSESEPTHLSATAFLEQNPTMTVLNVTAIPSGGHLTALNWIAGVDVVRIPHSSATSNLSANIYKPIAHQCVFNWCARSEGSLVVQKNTAAEQELKIGTIVFEKCVKLPGIHLEKCLGFVPGRGHVSSNLSHSESAALVNTIQDQPQESTVFVVDPAMSELLGNLLYSPFAPGVFSVLADGHVSPGIPYNFASELGNRLYHENSGNISKTMEKYAAAVTHALKSSYGTRLQGQSYHPETFVHIAWGWLIFPASIVLLSTALLFVSILFSTKKTRLVWKTSALAPLFHGLQGWSPEAYSGAMTGSEMEEVSAGMLARLQENDEGHILLRRIDG